MNFKKQVIFLREFILSRSVSVKRFILKNVGAVFCNLTLTQAFTCFCRSYSITKKDFIGASLDSRQTFSLDRTVQILSRVTRLFQM